MLRASTREEGTVAATQVSSKARSRCSSARSADPAACSAGSLRAGTRGVGAGLSEARPRLRPFGVRISRGVPGPGDPEWSLGPPGREGVGVRVQRGCLGAWGRELCVSVFPWAGDSEGEHVSGWEEAGWPCPSEPPVSPFLRGWCGPRLWARPGMGGGMRCCGLGRGEARTGGCEGGSRPASSHREARGLWPLGSEGNGRHEPRLRRML